MAQDLAALKVTNGGGGDGGPEQSQEQGWGELVAPIGGGGEADDDPNFAMQNWSQVTNDNGTYWWNR